MTLTTEHLTFENMRKFVLFLRDEWRGNEIQCWKNESGINVVGNECEMEGDEDAK